MHDKVIFTKTNYIILLQKNLILKNYSCVLQNNIVLGSIVFDLAHISHRSQQLHSAPKWGGGNKTLGL